METQDLRNARLKVTHLRIRVLEILDELDRNTSPDEGPAKNH